MPSNTSPGRTTSVAVVSVFAYLSLSHLGLVVLIFTLLGLFEIAALIMFQDKATRRDKETNDA